jgi:hypothetical protein
MAQSNPNISKILFFKKPKFWQTTLFIGAIYICDIQDCEKSLRMRAILGKKHPYMKQCQSTYIFSQHRVKTQLKLEFLEFPGLISYAFCVAVAPSVA